MRLEGRLRAAPECSGHQQVRFEAAREWSGHLDNDFGAAPEWSGHQQVRFEASLQCINGQSVETAVPLLHEALPQPRR